MNQPKFISKHKKIEKSTDFKFLRNQGIKSIQKLTGSYWTDFNLHDPGVTILEQLCYAITDLGYRTSADIEKHIFSNNNESIPFFKPEEILTNSPITIEDFRKIFIDSIPEIRNVWMTTAEISESAFNGLYKIQVDIANQEQSSKTQIKALHKKIAEVFSLYRSIGEDIFEIDILEELPIKIQADIETDGLHDLEKILAQIYYQVEQSLAPEVKFYSLQELVEKGLSFEEIFNGPRLKNGFILSNDLSPKKQVVFISDIVRGIMQINGITSVKQLTVEIDGQKFSSHITIPANKISRVITRQVTQRKTNDTDSIRFFKGSLEYTGVNQDTFVRYLNELVSENKKSYRISEFSFVVPKNAEPNNFDSYYSIQNHFPGIYGIGPDGIPGRPGPQRKAKAKQLKAYLLLFEQIMANYLSQLAHFNELLSIHKKQDKTYFTQPLSTIPNSNGLFRKEQGLLSDVYLDLDNIPADYHEGLPKLNKLFDNYIDRRNRFLDYLLALHGETFTQHALQQFNPYYSNHEFNEFIILCKTALLQNVCTINYGRSQGVNYLANKKGNVPALVQRVAISLGFGIQEMNEGKIEVNLPESYFDVFDLHKLSLISQSAKSLYQQWIKDAGLPRFKLTSSDLLKKFDIIDDNDINSLEVSDDDRKTIIKTLWPFKAKGVNKDFLSAGIILDNYKIGYVSSTKKYLLAFWVEQLEDWIIFGEYQSDKEAHIAVKVLIEEFKKININGEGVSMIEHILLRPDANQNMFGIYINDSNGKHLLKSNKQYSIAMRDEVMEKVKNTFSKEDAFFVEADDNREMNVVFDVKDIDLTFRSINPNVSVEETHLQKEKLIEFLGKKSESNDDEMDKFGFYIQYGDGKIDIPEEFFSFQISLIFPEWTARFQSQEFREIANDIVMEQKPANVSATIGWFRVSEMKKLESYIKLWKDNFNLESSEKNFDAMSDLAEYLYIKNYN